MWVAQGLDFAATHGASVVNMSLGTSSDDCILREAVAQAYAAGCTIVAASGNGGGGGTLAYPAPYEEGVAVGSVGSTGVGSAVSQDSGRSHGVRPRGTAPDRGSPPAPSRVPHSGRRPSASPTSSTSTSRSATTADRAIRMGSSCARRCGPISTRTGSSLPPSGSSTGAPRP